MNKQQQTDNKIAIVYADKGCLYKAQSVFRKNVKKNKCYLTLNNIGVFYNENGVIYKNGKVRDGKALSLHYLKQAISLNNEQKSFFSIAEVYYKYKKYAISAYYFNKAYEKNNSVEAIFNCGNAYYCLGDFERAAVCFKEATNVCKDRRNDRILVYRAFCIAYAKKYEKYDMINELLQSMSDDEIFEKFFLAYTCGFNDKLHLYIDYVITHFCLSLKEKAIVIDALNKIGEREKATAFCKNEIERLQDSDYNTSTDIKKMSMYLSDEVYRKKTIDEYRFPIALMKQCCYLGCPIHLE